ncbi:hypothetical protein CHX23_23540 [Rhodococcoides fascians]|nr:hypothetical protein CHX23_23540 [Rhodococcus fascians]
MSVLHGPSTPLIAGSIRGPRRAMTEQQVDARAAMVYFDAPEPAAPGVEATAPEPVPTSD